MKCPQLLITVLAGLVFSQSAFPQRPVQAPKSKKLEAERIRKERQTEARFLLVALATDARSFRDQTLRARSLARIADALWEIDPEQGRTLFRKAWEAAEVAYRENNERLNIRDGLVSLKPEEVNAVTFSSIASTPNLYKEILRLAAQHDRLLVEEFLEKLNEAKPDSKNENTNTSLWDLPDALEQRLNLADDLLRAGNSERALQFAGPALSSVTISTLDFLTRLRKKDPVAADQRYASMLARTSDDMSSDANTISLLSSYIFTPNTYVIFNPDGGASFSGSPDSAPANVSPQLRFAFFSTASVVLLRPQPPPEQDRSSAGLGGKYLVVKRLLPLFEQYAPGEMTASMRGQLEALNTLVSDYVRHRRATDPVKDEIPPSEELDSREASLLEKIEQTDTSDERDELYFDLVLLALMKDDLKARDYAGKIELSGFRKDAEAWVDWALVVNAVSKKKIELAMELNRTGALTHIQRVWVFTQAAKLLAKTERVKASSLLDAATAEAMRIDGGDLDRPQALFGIANAMRVVEPARVSDAMFEAVKAANSTEGFTGEGAAILQSVTRRSVIRMSPKNIPEFDIAEVFTALANEDHLRAVQLARGFQAEAPRANATIAIARAVLNAARASTP